MAKPGEVHEHSNQGTSVNKVNKHTKSKSLENLLEEIARDGLGSNYEDLESRIKSGTSSDFGSIWNTLAQVKDGESKQNLQALAIFYLAANGNLASCGSIAIDKIGPGLDRKSVLEHCLYLSTPSSSQLIDFVRTLEYPDERRYVRDLVAAKIQSVDDLVALKDSGYTLSNEESHIIVEGLTQSIFQPFSNEKSEVIAGKAKEACQMVLGLEREKIVGNDTSSEFILRATLANPEIIFEILPDSAEFKSLVEKDSFSEAVRMIAQVSPERFFDTTGIHDLPSNRIGDAWNGWLIKDSNGASAWFERYQNKLSTSERDAISASFSRFALNNGEIETAKKWNAYIQDPKIKQLIDSAIGQEVE